jgi:hypothetical protein
MISTNNVEKSVHKYTYMEVFNYNYTYLSGLSSRSDIVKGARVDSKRVHEVMFATKQLNMQELSEILLDISDPKSVNYGKHMTKVIYIYVYVYIYIYVYIYMYMKIHIYI